MNLEIENDVGLKRGPKVICRRGTKSWERKFKFIFV